MVYSSSSIYTSDWGSWREGIIVSLNKCTHQWKHYKVKDIFAGKRGNGWYKFQCKFRRPLILITYFIFIYNIYFFIFEFDDPKIVFTNLGF